MKILVLCVLMAVMVGCTTTADAHGRGRARIGVRGAVVVGGHHGVAVVGRRGAVFLGNLLIGRHGTFGDSD